MKTEPAGRGRIPRVACRAFESFPAARTPLIAATVLPTQVWGATCDTFDRIGDLHPLPADLAPGDRILVPRTGAYSLVTWTNFNAAQAPQVLTFEDEADEGTWRLHDASGRRIEGGRSSIL
jgi:hypothetical protein